ncbi:MFS transporter [Ktedonosporobacter rubrisoli]|nr:MFS transporter [Ktedonosporobacter rubrisoli]
MSSNTSTLSRAQGSSSRPSPSTLTIIMVALLLTAFLEALDNLIVTPALPRMASSLQGLDQYTWVVTAYLLAATATIPVAGKLSDQFGRKRFLLGGIILFLLGSGLAGISQTMEQLILFRALQGLGTGIGIGLVAIVVGDIFPPEQRASRQGLLGIVFGISQLCGPTIGGWLTDHGPLITGFVTENTRWRWLFYLNLPIGLIALLLLVIFLPSRFYVQQGESGGQQATSGRIDWIGAGLLVVATCSLLFGLSLESGWTSPQVIVLLLAAGFFYILFLIAERKAVEPIIPLALFRQPVFAVNALLALVQGMILIGVFIPLTLFLQGILALSPTGTGALFTALSVSLSIGATLAGAAISRLKRYQLTAIVGSAIMTLGIFLLMCMGQESNLFLVGLALVLIGLGAGSFFAIQMVVAQNTILQSQLGVGTGVVRYLSQLGLTLGAALMGVVVNGAFAQHAQTSLQATASARLQLAGMLQNGFALVLILSVITLLATFFLKDMPAERTTRHKQDRHSTIQ